MKTEDLDRLEQLASRAFGVGCLPPEWELTDEDQVAMRQFRAITAATVLALIALARRGLEKESEVSQ